LSFNELLEQQTANRTRYYGKYRGLVRDNNDPTQRGRIKVAVPAVIGDNEVWALPCVPYTGSNTGTYFMPNVGAAVWVEFEAGDASLAIWTGGFWADDELPKTEQDNTSGPSLKIIRTEKGLLISFNDDDDKLTISDAAGNNILTLESNEGKIRIEAATKVVVEAPQIELVENSTHPLVFGDDLLQYLNNLVQIFNAHMHPGELAAGVLPVTPMTPVPPMPAATPALLSVKVKTG